MKRSKLTIEDLLVLKSLRVKQTAEARRSPLVVYSAADPADCYATPGEVGTLHTRRVDGNGWQQWVVELRFPRSRRLQLASTSIADKWSDTPPPSIEFALSCSHLNRLLPHTEPHHAD